MLLSVEPDPARDPPRQVQVEIAGEARDVPLLWVGPTSNPSRRTPIEAWLDLPAPWRALPAREASRTDASAPLHADGGFWAVSIDLPSEPTPAIRVRDQLVRIIHPESLEIAREGVASPNPDLVAALERELLEPSLRWHGRIGLERIAIQPAPSTFGDPIIEDWAQQIETRWRAALARLWNIDPDLAREAERTLWLTANLGGTSRWPMWPADPIELESLSDTLNDPSLSATQQADRVRRWLDDQPRVLIWIAEPALDSPGLSLGALNLTPETEVLWARRPNDAPTPHELAPGVAHLITLSGSPAWTISTRDRVIELSDPSLPTLAVPPGVLIGPLLRDWTLASLRAGSPRADAASDVRCLLYAIPGEAGPDSPRVWRLHAEARALPDDEALRMSLGPLGAPRGIFRCARDGSIHLERGAMPDQPAIVFADASRWTARIPIDTSHIEETGMLRLGLERLDPSGRRWSWPVARFPWDDQPGRALLDLRAWSGLPR